MGDCSKIINGVRESTSPCSSVCNLLRKNLSLRNTNFDFLSDKFYDFLSFCCVCCIFQELIGSVPEGFDNYFTSRFPRLLTEVYRVISQYCRDEEGFRKYFKSHVE